jgi:hypothetical protein
VSVPEPIQSLATNICQIDEPYDVPTAAPPPLPDTAAPPAGNAEPPPSGKAVSHLVNAHAAAKPPATACHAEGIAVATAGFKATVSLAAVILTAPTEVGLPIAIGKFIVDAIELGGAAAKLENCKDAAARAK